MLSSAHSTPALAFRCTISRCSPSHIIHRSTPISLRQTPSMVHFLYSFPAAPLYRNIVRVMTLGLFEALAPTSADSDGCRLPLLKILNVGVSGTDYITGSTGRIGRVCIPLLIDSLHARAAVSHALELLRIASNYFRILDEEQVEKVRGCASMVRVACHSHMDDDIVFKE